MQNLENLIKNSWELSLQSEESLQLYPRVVFCLMCQGSIWWTWLDELSIGKIRKVAM